MVFYIHGLGHAMAPSPLHPTSFAHVTLPRSSTTTHTTRTTHHHTTPTTPHAPPQETAEPKATVEDVHTMQENMENFIKQGGDALLPPLVVPVDWACADENFSFKEGDVYHADQASAELAGRALGNFLRGVKQSGIIKTTINVVAHSM